MTDEFKPTTEQIRSGYMYDGGEAEYHDPINGHLQYKQAGKWFDQWLAEHDAALRSEGFRAGVKAQKNHARAMSVWRLSDTSDPRPSLNDPYSGRAVQ